MLTAYELYVFYRKDLSARSVAETDGVHGRLAQLLFVDIGLLQPLQNMVYCPLGKHEGRSGARA